MMIEVMGERECVVLVEGKVFYLREGVGMNGFMMNKKRERFLVVGGVLDGMDSDMCN